MSDVVVLTQEGPEGIRYDFVDGCRVWVPEGGNWRIRLRDRVADTVVYQHEFTSTGMVQSSKRYYIPFEIKVWKDDKLVFTHNCDLKERDVLITMHLGGLGDHLAWIGHAAAFAQHHQCRLTCRVKEPLIPLFEQTYPDIYFVSDVDDDAMKRYYAHYRVLVFFEDKEHNFQPIDYRQSGLIHMGADTLGLPYAERRPRITIDPGGRPIKERYVCIGSQASGLSKYWNNPVGWYQVVRFLKEHGYRVICIDRSRLGGTETALRMIPHGVEDETGDRPLSERARWLKHADFFVGLSSGLSWLAWAVETPVVMISGYTQPYNEFYTPYRIINRHVCNSCGNDVTQRLHPEDPLFCPYHKGTDRIFECTRAISTQHVTSVIETIPGFGVQRDD